MKHKMYCIFARESLEKMGGNRGKMAAQAGHAYLHAFWDANRVSAETNKIRQAQAYYESERAYKIALVVDSVAELLVLQRKYQDICGTSLVEDAGFTVFSEPTITCLGLGPISEDNIGDDIKALKVFM